MKSSNIGGQAVLEGIMMRNGGQYAVAVRRPNQEIALEVRPFKSVIPWKGSDRIPLVRGVLNFVDALVTGVKTLLFSASVFAEEEEAQEGLTREEAERQARKEERVMAVVMVAAIFLALALFMVVPYGITALFGRFIQSRVVMTILEGVIRLGIFMGYIALISHMKDIRRTFMYHGAEHKCINCIEQGLDLTVENVRKSSKEHKRCGTSFLFFVVLVSIVLCFFITAQSQLLRVLIRLLLLPVVAGIAYEIIRLAGNSDHPVVAVLSRPGLWVQHMTTQEPDDDMIEVAIRAVEAVFDWRTYKRINFPQDQRQVLAG